MKLIVNMNDIARWGTFFFIIFLLQTTPVIAQAKAVNSKNQSEAQSKYVLKAVQEKIQTIKNKANLDETLKIRILNAYYASEDNIEELITLGHQIKGIQNQLKNLPVEIKQFEKRIGETERNDKAIKAENFSAYNTSELEKSLSAEKSSLNELTSSINQLEIKIAEQFKRPQYIRVQKAEVEKSLVNTQQEMLALVSTVSNKLELRARKGQLESRSKKLNAQLEKLNLENIAYPVIEQEQKLELQWLNIQSEKMSALIKNIDDNLSQLRQQEINKAQEELIQAQQEASGKHSLIQEETNQNIIYTEALQETNRKLERYLNKKSEIETRYKQLEADFKSAEKKISLAGLSPALGNLLREQRRKLPLNKNYQSYFEQIQQETAFASLESFQLDEVKKNLVSIDRAVSSKISTSVVEIPDELEKTEVKTELRNLLSDQKELVIKLGLMYREYSRTLADVDFSLHQLVKMGERFSHYLNQRLLWVPSAPVIDQNYVLEVYDAVVWFTQVSHWQRVVEDLKQSIQNYPLMALLGLLVVLLSLKFKKRIKLNLEELLKSSSKLYVDRSSFTFYGLGYVFLLALPLPLIVVWLGGIVHVDGQAATFSHSVAHGLLVTSVPLLLLQFFYRLFKPMGLVQSLFYWQDHSINLLYGQLKWMRFVVVPAVFLITLFADDTYYKYSYSLGRFALIITMLAMAYMYHRFAHPVSGLAKDLYLEMPNGWVTRLRYVWYGIAVLIPLVIVGFAIAGYYQSALELQGKLIILIRLIFFTALLHEVIMRAMFLANRQLALQNARQKRKLLEQSLDKDKDSSSVINIEEEPLLDIPKINEQSKKLLNTVIFAILGIGSWLTLRDIFPAFSIFNQVELWQHMDTIDGEEALQPITLANVLVSLVYLLVMLIFVKNFSGLIDMMFAGRYSMSAGSRYALIQLSRYVVIAFTFIAIANELGGHWSQVQWLVAAVSVGLGFGLQEIFANMVSGIILLFERPIRVGDTVTVGDITGKVSRIQMRATSLTDWDQKELIVPNKTFITDKLINWTLTDTVTRVVIPVGVSYDSDEELAQRLLMQVLEDAPLVLSEPAPTVLFTAFGESSLDFIIRMFVRDLGDRLLATDDIHKRIRGVFKEHNIEIPFPQRDLHIR